MNKKHPITKIKQILVFQEPPKTMKPFYLNFWGKNARKTGFWKEKEVKCYSMLWRYFKRNVVFSEKCCPCNYTLFQNLVLGKAAISQSYFQNLKAVKTNK